MPEVYVAAGSNVEPLPNLRRALLHLERAFGPLRMSTAYRNPAFGFPGPDFVNLVVGFTTGAPLDDVVPVLHAAEAACGRTRDAPKWAPRSMDLDLLIYGDLVIERPGLTLPRPDLERRVYMIVPLAELAPGLKHPVLGVTMAELAARCGDSAASLEPIDLATGHALAPPAVGR
jgi:2-amino-4-hydroxy-6-hydroxymethyldihydropteridine diphosphokinase